jgi:hypothetical protein
LLNAKVPQAALERRAIPAVAIVNQKSWWPSIPRSQAQHSTNCWACIVWALHAAAYEKFAGICRHLLLRPVV